MLLRNFLGSMSEIWKTGNSTNKHWKRGPRIGSMAQKYSQSPMKGTYPDHDPTSSEKSEDDKWVFPGSKNAWCTTTHLQRPDAVRPFSRGEYPRSTRSTLARKESSKGPTQEKKKKSPSKSKKKPEKAAKTHLKEKEVHKTMHVYPNILHDACTRVTIRTFRE